MRNFKVLVVLILRIGILKAQITPLVTSRVDTSQKDIKEIYEVYTKYLNSHPDSAYVNPYWNENEKPTLTKGFETPSDRFYFANYWVQPMIAKGKVTILAIEKAYNSDKYIIRTLINVDSAHARGDGRLYDPMCTTRYYASKTKKGWKLENSITEETKAWNLYPTKYINYIYSCDYTFNKELADKANSFCDSILKLFGIDTSKRFNYYLATSEEQMARLYNMDYWSTPVLGYVEFANHQIVSARYTEYHIHEFTHILLPRSKNGFLEEGKATYFGGPGSKSFQEALLEFSKEIKNNDTITFSMIYTRKYFHWTNSDPSYVTAAVVCKLVRDKKGIDGLKELLKCPSNSEEDFYKTVTTISGIDKKTFEKEIMQYIKTYSDSVRKNK